MARYGRDYYGGYGGFAPYVSVGERKAQAVQYAAKLKKQGRTLSPVNITGRAIAVTHWGKAWCTHLEALSDFANRLPRGRTYARNGSVFDLQISPGKIEALVSGSEIYEVTIKIAPPDKKTWNRLKAECSQSITSLIDLLQGRIDAGVMQRLADPKDGLFPRSREIDIDCSCPDGAGLCKHSAAVLYGVGNRLDSAPELLFTLRKVDHTELVRQAVEGDNLNRSLGADAEHALAGDDLGALFGIELEETSPAKKPRGKKTPASKPHATVKTGADKPTRKSAKQKDQPAKAKAATPAKKAPGRKAR